MIHMSEKLRNGRKMKLVDLDEVINAIESTDWYHITDRGKLSEGAEGEESALYKATDIFKAVGEVPEVDAIPVEWLSKLADECAKDEDPYVQINGLLINVVINRWEQRIEDEHET